MNVLILNDRDKKEIIKDRKNNKVFYLENTFSLSKIIKIVKNNNIDVIISKNRNIFLKIFGFLKNIPIIFFYELKNIYDIEKFLQNRIAYKHQKDIPVLMYHRVITEDNEVGIHDTYVKLNDFEQQMKYLYDNNYITLNFRDIEDGSYKKRFNKDKKYIIITFDDGYKDNLKNALPILKKYNLKFVLFLITGINYNKWDCDENIDISKREKRFELMNNKEVKELINSNLVEIGGHTTLHLDMVNVDLKEIKKDLLKSNKELSKIVGISPISFAYPWGKSTREIRKIVEEVGYKFAVSCEEGSPCFSDNLFEIVRVGIYSNDDLRKFKLKISGNYPFMREKRKKMKCLRNKIRKVLKMKLK